MKKTLLQLGLVSFTMGAQLLANPSGPTVVVGDVSFATDGNTFTITSNTDRSIVDWDDFSVGSQDQTNIVLPFSDSAILNRVTSTNVSNILGGIISNGNVYLINENGIVIGPSGGIESAGFLGASLEVLDSQFLNGGDMDFFSIQNNPVINYGVIYSFGDVILIGAYVENTGQIYAVDSAVCLGAANEVLVHPYQPLFSGNKITVITSGLTNQGGTGVNNTGIITGADIELKADGSPFALAINCEGYLHATMAIEVDGRVTLHTENDSQDFGGAIRMNGLITAAGASDQGGHVYVTGNDISILNDCIIDCSANNGGGEIFIGGSLQNSDPTVPTALTLSMDPGARFDVSSRYFGDGGTCVLWADDTVTFSGTIQAVAQGYNGDGGLVQVCGSNTTNFNGTVYVDSNNGSAGLIIGCQ